MNDFKTKSPEVITEERHQEMRKAYRNNDIRRLRFLKAIHSLRYKISIKQKHKTKRSNLENEDCQ